MSEHERSKAPLRRVLAWIMAKRWRLTIVMILATLLIVRLFAGVILTAVANTALVNGKDVRGHIGAISLSLLACDYTVHEIALEIRERDGTWSPLLAVASITCDLSWGPLLHGEVLGHVHAHKPIAYVAAKGEEGPSDEPEKPLSLPRPGERGTPQAPWEKSLSSVIRVHLIDVTVSDGELRYLDTEHGVMTAVTNINVKVDSLMIPDAATTHRSPFHLTATTPGDGRLEVHGDADVVATAPMFFARAELKDVDLVALNPLTSRLLDLTFADGTFTGYAEVVSDGRRLAGYLKVLLHHLEISSFKDYTAGGSVTFWTVLVEGAEDILENAELHQHAARISLSGPLKDPSVQVWEAITTALSNAFIRALTPGFGADR